MFDVMSRRNKLSIIGLVLLTFCLTFFHFDSTGDDDHSCSVCQFQGAITSSNDVIDFAFSQVVQLSGQSVLTPIGQIVCLFFSASRAPPFFS